jgi:hypothetical protein
MIRMRLSGGEKLQAKLRTFAKRWDAKAAKGMRRVADSVLAISQGLVPRDTEALAESGRVIMSPTGRSFTIVYGGPDIPYAIAVHEHLSSHSPASWVKKEERGEKINWTVPGTGPKYLELAMWVVVPNMAKILGEELQVQNEGI